MRAPLLWVGLCGVAFLLSVSGCGGAKQPADGDNFIQRPDAAGSQAVTLNQLTMPALSAAQPYSFAVTIPESPALELYYGFEGEPQAGVKAPLKVVIAENGKEILRQNIEAPLDESKWIRCEVSLGEFAGRAVEISLAPDFLQTEKTRLYWSVPVVFSRKPLPERAPAFLISIDTLRADHVSAYGYTRETTPHLDRWAKEEAVLFENATTPETWTLPAHMSMFTGLYPQHHAVSPNAPLKDDVASLPALLQAQGYLTAAFTGHTWWLRPELGFGRGMDYYNNPATKSHEPAMLRPLPQTLELARAWITDTGYTAPFLFLHAYDLHYKSKDMGELPYSPGDESFLHFSKPYLDQQVFKEGDKASLKASELLFAWREKQVTFTDAERDAVVALYDDALRMVDQRLAEFFAFLKEQGLYDHALIIVTADHGEGLGERGYYDHENVWEEEARIPLFVRLPHGEHAGKRVSAQVQLVDLLPTIAGVLGLPQDSNTDGLNLLKLIESPGAAGHENAYIRNGGVHLAVRTEKWKLHWTPQGENRHQLYNLQEDPGETRDELANAPLPAKELRKTAQAFFGLAESGWHIEVLAELNTAWRASLMLQVTPLVEEGSFTDKYGNEALLQPWDDGTFEREVGGAVPEHLTIPAPRGTLQVSITSAEVFDFHAEGQDLTDTRQVNVSLDATTTNYARPEGAMEGKRPRISIWYAGAPAANTGQTATIDAETQQQLEAIGYGESGKKRAE